MKNILFKLLSLVNSVIPKDDNLILFYNYGTIGDNPWYLFNELKERQYNKRLVWIVTKEYPVASYSEDFETIVLDSKLEILRFLKYIARAKYYVTSSGPPRWKGRNQIVISLWHGIPLKKLPSTFIEHGKYIDYLIVSSSLEGVLLSSSFHLHHERFIVLGHPRCDALFFGRKTAVERLNELSGKDTQKYDRIIMYLPTFRDYDAEATRKITSNLLINESFKRFLSENNVLFIMKPHPRDENYFEKLGSSNIIVLKNSDLLDRFFTLYDILPAVDVLITDYSSVYFDYLLLNRPIVFYVPDLEEYKETRGFLLEPYEKWTPGDKAKNVDELIDALQEAIENPDKWKREREWLRDIMFKYQDGKASERIIKYFWGDV